MDASSYQNQPCFSLAQALRQRFMECATSIIHLPPPYAHKNTSPRYKIDAQHLFQLLTDHFKLTTSIPMKQSLQLSEAEWLDLICDPVMAAEIIMNITLDDHQAARLRYFWWVPNCMDDSGVGTGKTNIIFIWQALRHILLPHPVGFANCIIALFYPTLSTATEAVGDAFEKFIENAPIFRNEIVKSRGGKYAIRKEEGYLEFRFRNGGITRMPALGMSKDGQNLASRRYHHGVCDEQKEMDKKSKVLDKQVLQRINAPTPNKNHPLLTNHTILLGHAEDPYTHPAYKRHRDWKKLIKEGSQEYAIMSASFRDWSENFSFLRNETEIRRDFISLSNEEFEQRRGGIWKGATEEWYEAKHLESCIDHSYQPQDNRNNPHSIIVCGKDVAKGKKKTSDLNALVNWQATPIDPATVRSLLGIYEDKFLRLWRIEPIFGFSSKGQGAPELSGAIHTVHNKFSLNRIVIDPGGGGQWVLSETHKSRQVINNVEVDGCTGLCEYTQQHLHPTSQPIIHTYTHGQLFLRNALEPKFFTSAEGPIEGMHRLAQNLFAKQSIVMPPFVNHPTKPELNYKPSAMANWTPSQLQSAKFFEVMHTQLLSIEYEKDKDGNARLTANQFLKFSSKEKKDAAYAALYGLVGLISLLNDPELYHD
jgi:hypothetical protein